MHGPWTKYANSAAKDYIETCMHDLFNPFPHNDTF